MRQLQSLPSIWLGRRYSCHKIDAQFLSIIAEKLWPDLVSRDFQLGQRLGCVIRGSISSMARIHVDGEEFLSL